MGGFDTGDATAILDELGQDATLNGVPVRVLYFPSVARVGEGGEMLDRRAQAHFDSGTVVAAGDDVTVDGIAYQAHRLSEDDGRFVKWWLK